MTNATAAAGSDVEAGARIVRMALIALLCGAVGIAFSPIFVRLSELEPTATAFHRMFLALPALWAWGALIHTGDGADGGTRSRRKVRPETVRDFALLALAGVLFAGDLIFWHWSVRFTTVANSTLMANFAPIIVTVASFVLYGERFSKLFLLGMALGLTGAGVLMGESLSADPDQFLGDAFGIVTALFYASYLMVVSRLRVRFSTTTIMIWSTAAGSAVLLPVTLIMGEGLIATTVYGWTILVALAWISQAAGQGLIAYALAHLPTAFSSVSLLLQPVIVVFLGWFILGEALEGMQAVGAGIVLAGIVAARLGSRGLRLQNER